MGIRQYAAVAQLEERIPAKDEVRGSSPLGCTITELEAPAKVFFIALTISTRFVFLLSCYSQAKNSLRLTRFAIQGKTPLSVAP